MEQVPPRNITDPQEALLTKQQAARFLTVSVKTLDRWIYERRGPKYHKVGALVRYRPEDLIAFLAGCPTGGGGLHVITTPQRPGVLA